MSGVARRPSDLAMGALRDAVAGLCETCAHARQIVSERGSTFWLCRLAATDPRFARYPRLPVAQCSGFADLVERGGPAADAHGDPA